MSGAGDWGTDKARKRLQKDTPGQNKVGENIMEPTIKIDGRTKAFKEKVAKLAYEKAKQLKAATFDNPLKGYPYNERMTKEHSEELMSFVKKANEAGIEPADLMDAVENWMSIKGYKTTQEEQWGVENPYLRYDNDKLKQLKTKHKDNYGKLKNKIRKMMGIGGAAPQGLKDELKDLERKIKQVEDAIKMKPFVKKESADMKSYKEFSELNEAKVTMAKLKPGMTFDVIHSGRSARNFGVNGQNVYGGKVKVLGMGNVPSGKKAEKKHVFAKDMKDAQNKFRDIWNKEEIRYGYFGSSLGRIKAFFNAIAAESEGKKIPYGHTCWIWEVIEGENKGVISYCFISFDEKWEVVFLNKATEFQLIS